MPKGFLDDAFTWLIQQEFFNAAVTAIPGAATVANRLIIGRLVTRAKPRPHPFSLWTPGDAGEDPAHGECYVSWAGLTDRGLTARHLPPADPEEMKGLPDWRAVQHLFAREEFRGSPRSSALFPFFAQWFTEGFLRTHAKDRRRNTSNHEIDLCQIYGLTPATAAMLRVGGAEGGGRLRTEKVGGAEYPPRLYDESGDVRPEFRNLPYVKTDPPPEDITPLDAFLERLGRLGVPAAERARRRRRLYATGLETGNGTVMHTALNTIFLRQHNRVCEILRRERRGWDDHRLFEAARAVTVATVLRLVVTEYINHISGLPFQFRFDRNFAERRRWYRANRISLEFNLLYRWHSLVPDRLVMPDDEVLGPAGFSLNNALLERHGPARLIAAASGQPAGRYGLRNTPDFLMPVEQASFEFARRMRVRSYSEYRERFGFDRVRDFEDLIDEPGLAAELRRLYRKVDRVDFLVGLMAERRRAGGGMFGPLMFAMVGSDAFSHILTNPLLSGNVYGEALPGPCAELAAQVTSLEQLVRENTQDGEAEPGEIRASFALLPDGPRPRPKAPPVVAREAAPAA